MTNQSLYDDDIVAWAKDQAAALRRLAGMQAPGSNVVDWPNVIEEIEDVGRSNIATVESLIRQTLVHLIKVIADPSTVAVGRWEAEGNTFQADALARYAPSMAHRIDLERAWRKARHIAAGALKAEGAALAPDLPETCPLTWDELLDDDFDLRSAVEIVRGRLEQDGGLP